MLTLCITLTTLEEARCPPDCLGDRICPDGGSSWRGTQLPKPLSYEASSLSGPLPQLRAMAQALYLAESLGGLGGAFALEKAVLLSLPDGRTPMRAWDLAIDSKRHCEADVQRALAFLLCSRSSKQTLLLYWWIFCQRRLCFHAQRVLLPCAAVGSHVSSCRLARCPRSAERLLAASDLLPPQRDGCSGAVCAEGT